MLARAWESSEYRLIPDALASVATRRSTFDKVLACRRRGFDCDFRKSGREIKDGWSVEVFVEFWTPKRQRFFGPYSGGLQSGRVKDRQEAGSELCDLQVARHTSNDACPLTG